MPVNASDPPRPRGRWSLETFTDYLPTVGGATALGLLVGILLIGASVFGGGHLHSATASIDHGADHNAAAGAPVSVDIELGDLFIKPSSITVPAGSPVVVHVVNNGNMQHSLSLEGREEPLLDPGKSTTLNWGPFTESTQAWCQVAGHKEAGMLLTINVTGGAAAPAADTAAPAADTAGDDAAKIDPAAKPGPDWQPFDPELRPAEGGTEHNVTFHVKELEREVAPGVRQLQWTYNGQAPGPILRGRVGDVFKVTLVNDGSMEHSIDFHASKVSPNVEMRTLKPGESLVYEFKARFSGIFTYHCGAEPMIYHMGNGMFGAVVIDPPKLPKVDREFVFVQSELNLGPQGKTGDLQKMMSGENDAVVFNGYLNQYVYSPIKIKQGERIRVWVDNAAINQNVAFHVVGSIFDTVWKEGAYRLTPDMDTKGGSQTLDLQPTQGGFVEFTLDAPGAYTFVNHKMMNLARGAAGVFQVEAGDKGEGSDR
ncbi:multicopper oxidase domain-containing protein [Sphaerimonospora sp. CA-214678]|uniref:multicopper oxidase domain-containing protein n=1 Tax=Sphaerimonospora sp. CA-214678 TaxID=3240029 RepID=UPI003D945EEC